VKADFSKIISDSIQITKSNKKLWIFGLVVVALSAGASLSSGGSLSNAFKGGEDGKQKQENSAKPNESNLPTNPENSNLLNTNLLASELPQVLGTATNGLLDLAKTIPMYF